MSCLSESSGQYMTVELSGKTRIKGYLADYGLDILVIQYYNDYYYIPLLHVQNISLGTVLEDNRVPPVSSEIESDVDQTSLSFEHPFQLANENISFRKMLQQARGHFVELYVSGNMTIHGYLTSVMNDYFVFHSPVYKTIYVTLSHLKWLMPYPDNVTPYALNPGALPHHATPTSMARTFKEQCNKLIGQLVVFDMGENSNKIGQLKSIDSVSNMAELYTADGTRHLLNLSHLKTVYLP